MHDHVSEEQLILHYYGEPDADPRIERHLLTCASCRLALAQLGETLSLVEAHQPPEPLAGLEARVWARMQTEIDGRRQASWFSRVFSATPRWAMAGGIAAIVVAAFMAGRFTHPAPEQMAEVVEALDDARERVFVIAIGDHLDQSQMVLMELLNADAQTVANIAGEQVRARDLVAANRLYRQTAVQSGDQSTGELLDVLERVLLEIANAPAEVSADDLDALRASIQERGILFRVRVVASEMRQREKADVVPAIPVTGT